MGSPGARLQSPRQNSSDLWVYDYEDRMMTYLEDSIPKTDYYRVSMDPKNADSEDLMTSTVYRKLLLYRIRNSYSRWSLQM